MRVLLHIAKAWKRYLFQAEPSCIGHYSEYPSPRGSKSMHAGIVKTAVKDAEGVGLGGWEVCHNPLPSPTLGTRG